MTKLDRALAWAARGFPVFRLQPNGKEPNPGSHGHLEATTDLEKIREWWTDPLTGSPLDWNIGCSPRDGRRLILDLDVKEGRQGISDYLAFGGRLDGLVVRTPTGGLHVYCAGEDFRTGAGRLAPGIDTRGADGYVVAPGSTIDGVPYEIVEDSGELLPVPEFVAERVGTRTERDRNRIVHTTVEDDQPRNVERFVEACKRALPASPGCWHDMSRDLACEAIRCAVSIDKALEVMAEHWVPRGTGFFEDGRHERWAADVAGSYQWAMQFGEHGMHSVDLQVSAMRDLVVVPPPDAGDPSGTALQISDIFYSRTWVEGKKLRDQPVEYTVKGLIGPGDLMAVLGGPGSGKSVLLPYLAFCVALGRPFLDRRVRQGRVLYFAPENGLGLEQRMQALGEEFGDPGEFLRIFPLPMNLSQNEPDAVRMGNTVRHYDPALVIIDTVFSGYPDVNLTDAKEVGYIVKSAKILTEAPSRPIIAFGHHTPKNGTETAYGGQQLQAALDTTLFVSGELRAPRTVQIRKNRRGPDGETYKFRIRSVDLFVDDEGDPVTAPILEWFDEAADQAAAQEAWLAETTSAARTVLDVLNRLADAAVEAGLGASPGELLCGAPRARVRRDALAAELVSYGTIEPDVGQFAGEKMVTAWLQELKRRDFADYDSAEVWPLPRRSVT